jgi:hypothetical protein
MRVQQRIIGALLLVAVLLAAGCSVLRTMGYSQAPNLLYWRLDEYFDFDDEQAPRVREAVAEWVRWHRTTQLPDYAALAGRLRAQAGADTTPEQTCAWWREVGGRVDAALERAAPLMAGVAATLTPEQLKHAERRFAKSATELRRETAQDDAAERQRAAVKRAVERFEMFYGRLDGEQRKRVAASVAASPFDAEAFVAERRARHQDAMQALRRAAGAPRAEAEAALRELAAQTQVSPRPAYREQQRKLIDYNCAFAAELHNLTTPKQRDTARHRLGEWQDDFTAWANGG